MKDFKELSVEEVAKLETEEQVKYFNDLNTYKEAKLTAFKEQLKKDNSEALEAQIKTLKEEMNTNVLEQTKVLRESMKAQGLAINKLMEQPKTKGTSLMEDLVANKEVVSEIMDGVKKEVVVKATPTARAAVLLSKETDLMGGLGQLATRALKFYDIFPKIPISKDSGGVIAWYDWDEATTVRAAAMVAEGETFPTSEAQWKWYSMPVRKIGDTMTTTDEFKEDMPRFAAELDLFIRTNVDLITDEQIYKGDNTGENLKGLIKYAPTFTATAQGITDANIGDLIMHVKSGITKSTGSKYMPNFVAMNSADFLKYIGKKDANNNYMVYPFATADGKNIDGLTVVVSDLVTANTMVMGDSNFGKIFEKPGVSLEPGYKSGDWEKDLGSIKARRRLCFIVRNADLGAFSKVTSISEDLVTLKS